MEKRTKMCFKQLTVFSLFTPESKRTKQQVLLTFSLRLKKLLTWSVG